MLSFYDALSFATRKKTLFIGFITAMIMLFFGILACISLENHFSFYTLFKTWLAAEKNSTAAYVALSNIAFMLKEPIFWGIIFKKVLWMTFLLICCGFSFFTLELVIAKKALFNQPPRFTAEFFIITLSKMMLLLTPLLILIYTFLYFVLKSFFAFIAGTIIGLEPSYQFPFNSGLLTLTAIGAFIYFIYVMLLFIERFSFETLFSFNALKVIKKHWKTVLELIVSVFYALFTFFIGLMLIGFLYWQSNSLYACFFSFCAYLIWILILNTARFIFTLPILITLAGLAWFRFNIGTAFMSNYLFSYLLMALTYFVAFFFWAMFWATQGYLFASAAFVLRFNKTPAKDEKKHSPEKLRCLETLYADYLREHKNDTQDNYFHHLTREK